jgi:stearoyl-CoA desaturase (delta-9 desaturase)
MRRDQPVPARRSARAQQRAELLERFSREQLCWGNFDWPVFAWTFAMHAGCIAAAFFFTWQALALAVALHWLTASIGICLGYHRFLTHRSMKLRGPARFFVTLCGVISGEGSPLMWCATHRIHHARSDQAGDPHSPLDGGWWSHLLWLFVRHDDKFRQALFRHYVPDLLQDRVLVFFDRTYGLWLFASGGLLYVLGGWPFLLWGLCVRMVVAYHSTWFVNSATHLWGYRNYETDDESKNLWWVALMSYGEGWHNNHHAHPRLARAGHKWWELDMTFYAIRVLQALRLAYAVDDRIPAARTAPATVAVEPAGAARTHSGTHVKG